ncbi:hypothetical protein [Aquimarina algicola]|uniref:hypothetical protein n=1 Tax=Aquimarina algicola TaxID=2589995 RepID=UPI001CF5E1FD|nr:hypothetical protein [Aquimarina algicola]
MKTLLHIFLGILLVLNFVSCDPPAVNEELGIDQVETVSDEDDGEGEMSPFG